MELPVLPSIDLLTSTLSRDGNGSGKDRHSKRSSPSILDQQLFSSSSSATAAGTTTSTTTTSARSLASSIEQIPTFLPMDFLQSPEGAGGGGGEVEVEEEVPPKGGGLLTIGKNELTLNSMFFTQVFQH